MKAWELEKGNTFSIDGGQTWLIVLGEPRDGDNDDTVLFVCPRDDVSLGASYNLNLPNYDYVWEPDPEAVYRGDNYLPVKKEE